MVLSPALGYSRWSMASTGDTTPLRELLVRQSASPASTLRRDSWLASLAHLGLALACPASDLKRACAMIEEFSDPGRLPAIAAAVEQDLTAARANVGNGRGVEDPSEAELAVLRCLATGLSRREIGARLYISLNTVKTHNRELYRKLGATSRAEAVARGEALGLLEPTESPG